MRQNLREYEIIFKFKVAFYNISYKLGDSKMKNRTGENPTSFFEAVRTTQSMYKLTQNAPLPSPSPLWH